MARSITFKFGADTSQLTKALGSVRKQIGGMLGGVSLGGIVGAGIAGFGLQQMIGAAMNISPKFANTMLEAEEKAVRGFAAALYQVQPQILQLANEIPMLIAAVIKGAADLSATYQTTQRRTATAAGLFTESAMGIKNRFRTASSYEELFMPSLMQAFAGYMSLPGTGPQLPEMTVDVIANEARRRANAGIGGQARRTADPAQPAEPRP